MAFNNGNNIPTFHNNVADLAPGFRAGMAAMQAVVPLLESLVPMLDAAAPGIKSLASANLGPDGAGLVNQATELLSEVAGVANQMAGALNKSPVQGSGAAGRAYASAPVPPMGPRPVGPG